MIAGLAARLVGITPGSVIAFLGSPLATVGLVAAIGLGGFVWGHAKASSAYRAEKAASTTAAATVDTQAATTAKAAMERETRESLARLAELEKEIANYARTHASCLIGASGAGFLDGLRGQPVPGSPPLPPARR